MGTKLSWKALSAAATAKDPASELTHGLYRYPGSMSPWIARALISALSRPGEVVLDPFCGGGTTLIEALAMGRRAVGTDLNGLACFITKAKATPTNARSLEAFRDWYVCARSKLDTRCPAHAIPLVTQSGTGYAPKTHGVLLWLKRSARRVQDGGARRLSRLAVLRTGKLCFDCRTKNPSPEILRRHFTNSCESILDAAKQYGSKVRVQRESLGPSPWLRVLQGDSAAVSGRLVDCRWPISLVVTSPPYPGVHALYHRWQLRGRQEIPLPYEILDIADGRPESAYALGPRQEPGNSRYFLKLQSIFTALRPVLAPGAVVAQVIAFADPDSQIPAFHSAMEGAGFEGLQVNGESHPTVSRMVPNRRWYAAQMPNLPSAREYLFLHRARIGGPTCLKEGPHKTRLRGEEFLPGESLP